MRIENWNGYDIRFIEKDSEWWAVATDIAKALGHRDARTAVRGLKSKYKGTQKVRTTSNNVKAPEFQEMTVLNEKGIYRLIMRSNKPEAEDFQDFVYETIKELRKASGLEGFQIFKTLDKEHQREMMKKLHDGLKVPVKVDYIKANTIANKAISLKHGYPKMIKKADMDSAMLTDRQHLLDDTVELMTVKDKYKLEISVSQEIYKNILKGE